MISNRKSSKRMGENIKGERKDRHRSCMIDVEDILCQGNLRDLLNNSCRWDFLKRKEPVLNEGRVKESIA